VEILFCGFFATKKIETEDPTLGERPHNVIFKCCYF
jgi:hypothetical protein